MPVTLRLSLAAAFLLAAVLLPAAEIDSLRANRVLEREQEANREAARLTPVDDVYVDRVNHPYPIKSSSILRLFLIADAALLMSANAFMRRLSAPTGVSRVRAWEPNEAWMVIGLTALGATLRFTGANRDLWLDEVITLTRRIDRPLLETLVQSVSPNNHLLYSLLSRASVSVFGESPWALRLPAMLFGIATIPVFYALVRRFSPSREAFLATLGIAASYHHLFFSQNARGYTGFLFGGLLGTLALLEALDRDSGRAWALYVAAMVVSVVSVVIGAALLAAQVIAVSVFRPTRRFYWMLGITTYLIAHAYAPIIPDIFGFVFDEYRRPELGFRFSGELVQAVLRDFALGPAAAGVLVVGGAIAIGGTVSYWRQDRLFASLLLLPEILMVALFAGLRAAIFPRLFLFALPVAVILGARGVVAILDRLPSATVQRFGYRSAIAGLIGISVFMLATWWRYPMQDYRGARRFVEERRRDGDAVVTVGLASIGYRYYWPEILATERISELERIAATHRRVWLLYAFPRDIEKRRPKLRRFITDQFRAQTAFRGLVGDGDIRVRLRESAP